MAIGATALMIGGGAFQAATSIMGGNAQAKSIQNQANFDAQVYEQQAEMIKEKKKIADYQFNRQAASARGSVVAATAGKGFFLSGSPLAILIDNESQMQFDKAVGDYNMDIEANYAKSGANYYRQSGEINARNAKMAGYSNAFSSLLNVGLNAKMPRLGGGSSNPFSPMTIEQVRMGSTYRGGAA